MSATTSLLFGLLVAIVVLATVATRLRLPYAILLVIGGLALGFVPGLPAIELNPELVLVLFLPPLIYSSAWLTSWREFRATLRPILQLSLGLVLVTTLVIGVVAHFIAGLSWPVAFVLGAVVSPTDAVAASATAREFGLPRRIVTVIEGESMVNDASGLVLYRFAVAAVITGSFSLWQAGLQFVLVSVGGLLIGLQMRRILEAIAGHSLLTLIWQALFIGLAVTSVRFAWVFPAALLPRKFSARLRARDPYPGWHQVAIVAWVGMRGGLSLAAALALPLTLAGGASFPQRDTVIFFTFAVILLTLVDQGLSLGPLIRLLGIQRDSSLDREHALARLVATRAALARLDELAGEKQMPQDALARLRSHYTDKLEALNNAMDGTGDERFDGHEPTQQRLRREVLDAERAAVISLRDRGRIDDETLRLVERELDLEEQRWQ
jgi:NhaP-type Na+/H+ or K+/H+ antiporter